METALKIPLLIFVALAAVPGTSGAQEAGLFAGFDLLGGGALGTSHTTDGGAPFAGGGIVDNVRFGAMAGVGGHIGYRLDGPLSVFVSYQHVRSDIGWDASFPVFDIASRFDGTATSDALLANLAYDVPLSQATGLNLSAGVGATLNTLSGIAETDVETGSFLADIADHSALRPTGRIAAALEHEIGENSLLSLGASLAYVGGFETGTTRRGNLGVTDINPYGIDDVWRAGLGVSLQFQF